MVRRCARPDCHEMASATLSYGYGASTVWIDHLAGEAHPMVHDLCERHADVLSVPRGWQLRDARSGVPAALFGSESLAS